MRFRAYIPQEIVQWVRLLQVQRRYPHANYIRSPYVHPSARVGVGSSIGRNVVVNAEVTLGDYSYANQGVNLFSGIVGRFCSIGHYSMIGPENHPTDHLSTAPDLYRGTLLQTNDASWYEFPAPPIVGSDVWIGTHATVLQGVTIGHGAIIGSGAVVTKDVAPFTIVGGVPARPIRARFDDKTISRLMVGRWWELSLDELKKQYGAAFAAGSDWQLVN